MTTEWIPAALSSDLPRGGVMASVCGTLEVAVWRSASGRVAAWVDRCPHRGMRLSHGFVRGEMLSCIYHGWRFDGAGRCRKIPAHPDLDPPETIRTQSLACLDAQGVIWIASEAPAVAPPDLGNVVPLRSLTFEAGIDAVAAMTGEVPDRSLLRLDAHGPVPPLVLLLQALGPGRSAVHALAAPTGTGALVAASRALEDFRRRTEAQGIAA
ncbi:Rieske (2Fe-2S) protein [Rubellimicrobium rubrum]|uniref:Rieske (2Fe-2S) protein n=1 Tax=Rubellimicrobium rubrum TaxID=2585369 RepID=A0A5C4N1G4_9RHOB|nr:Rieske (2Fe-2S) protein [Rubellimicrobium rubrum]TNC51621.1 Rieske (2Fe-2S) protein [Rubellimicrobium rubrum]